MDLVNKENIVNLIYLHQDLFGMFDGIYLFGSVVKEENIPNDIDLLLIYKKYSKNMCYSSAYIKEFFLISYDIYLDIVVMSEKEEEELKFIEKLELNYIKIK